MVFDATIATRGERRAVLLLAKMYDGGARSVDAEDFPAVLGVQGNELEALLRSMSQSNLIWKQSRDGFSLTAMIVDAADRIRSAPALDVVDSITKISNRGKLLAMLLLLFGGLGFLLLLAGSLLREVPVAPAPPVPVRVR